MYLFIWSDAQVLVVKIRLKDPWTFKLPISQAINVVTDLPDDQNSQLSEVTPNKHELRVRDPVNGLSQPLKAFSISQFPNPIS